ncbi:MAG: hypothetical protein CMO98_07435, partial [Woeseia sp.]|nr:hypothetical protein [Woeseia sp.]
TEEAEEVSTTATEEETAAEVAWEGSMGAVEEEPADEPVAVAMGAAEEQPAEETKASSDETSARAWLADAFGFL